MLNRMTRGIAALIVLSISLAPTFGTATTAAQAPAKQGQEPVLRARVELVSVFATVRDSKKKILADLTKEDFTILEDNESQKVEFFSRETNLPITLGLLIDTSGSQERVLGAEQEAASQFLRRVLRPEKDLALVISFDSNSDLLADWTSDPDRLDRAIQRARINAPQSVTPGPFPLPLKGTVFYDAIYSTCRQKLAEEAGRKALVILTDADDQGSEVSLQEALETAQKTNTVIHIIYINDPRGGGRGWGAAKKLSEETGGRLMEVSSGKDLEKAFDQISEELRSQYTLGYYSTNKVRDGAFRKIKVETSQKDAKVLVRKGYYGPRG